MSNGNVTPSDAPISRSGNLYELTGDINAQLVVLKNNIVIDGNGYAITGTDRNVGKGVYLNDLTNVAIRNLKVSNFFHAISIDGCSFVVVEDNYLENQGSGIVLDHGCYSNTVSGNTINSTRYNSLFLGECVGNQISDNTIINAANVLDSYDSSENRVFMNTVVSYSGYLGFYFPSDCHDNILYRNQGASINVAGDNNTIYENECGIYFAGTNNRVFHNNGYGIGLTDASNCEVYENTVAELRVRRSTNNIIRDNNINGTGTGVDVDGECINTTIQNNNITTFGSVGVALDSGIGTKVLDNKIQAINSTGIEVSHYGYEIVVTGNSIANCEQGIAFMWGSSNHVISGNTIARNQYGVVIVAETNITITENLITSNVYGVYMESRFGGNRWYYATANNITSNVISKNVGSGIFFNASSQKNTVTKNVITENNYAVLIGDDSSRNNFYQNNIIDNNATVGGFAWREHWNSTYPVGGNYWSSYSGTDNNGDGIGDTEHIVNEINKDYYPLMAPVGVPTLTVPFILPEYMSSIIEPTQLPQTYSRVYIWPDGLVEPSVAPISRSGNFYELTGDLNAELLVEKSSIVFDGKNYTIKGKKLEEGRGIYLEDLTSVTIKNFRISNFEYAIYLDNSSFVSISDNHLLAQCNGIVLDSFCNNNTISANTLNSTRYNSLFLADSSGNTICNNTVKSTATIIDAYNSSENQVFNNHVTSSKGRIGFGFRALCNNNVFYGNEGPFGIFLQGDNNTIFENNIDTINLDRSDFNNHEFRSHNNVIYGNIVHHIGLKYTYNSLVYNNTLTIKSDEGMSVGRSEDNIIRDNWISGEGIGINFESGTKNNTIEANTVTTQSHPAINMDGGARDKIIDNKIQAINSTGISIVDGNHELTVTNNAIGNCEKGIQLESRAFDNVISGNTITLNHYGVYFCGAPSNVILGNAITDNVYGVYSDSFYIRITKLWYYSSNNNITANIISRNSEAAIFLNNTVGQNFVVNNDIKNNNIGVKIGENSSLNTFYQNNIVDNNVSVTSFPWIENWNTTYPVGGNYWSNYTGTDSNSDGIGDTEHIIDENNIDYYPLMLPVDVPTLEVQPALPVYVPPEPEEPETPTEPETPQTPEEPETPTEPEQPTEPETHEEPELPTTEEPVVSTELLVAILVAAVCIVGVASYWTHKRGK